MPAFEIYYRDNAGDVSCAFSVQFEDVLRAKILAHAMKPADCREMEVWADGALVYRRPESDESLDRHAGLVQIPSYDRGYVTSTAG
jgi:hypothetical protein